jgi:hypothetical protein
MKTRFLTVLAAAGALALVGPESRVSAQSTAAAAGSIVAFSSVPWGSSEAAVVARAGRPQDTQSLHGLRALVYMEHLLGQTVTTVYVFHPQHGLVAGSYTAPYTYGNSCWEIYSSFKSAITARYAELTPDVTETNESSSLDMCAAIGIHRATAMVIWTDPVSGARASVQIKENPREVQTMYVSGEGRRAFAAMNQNEVRDHF